MPAFALVVAIGLSGPSADAGPAPGLCQMQTDRGKIPSGFAIEACFDGKTVTLRNDLEVALSVETRGDVGRPSRSESDHGLAAEATRLQSEDSNILLPGDTLRFPVGAGKAALGVGTSNSAGFYALATTADNFIPGRPSAVIGSFTSFMHEVDGDFSQYENCLAGKNWIGQLGCKALLTRNLTYAVGRGTVKGAASGLVGTLLAAATFARWFDAQPDQVKTVLHSPPIELKAAGKGSSKPPPPAPPPKQAPKPKPAPAPKASSLSVGSSFDDECVVAWPTAPVRSEDSIELTMSCQHVPEDEFLFTAVIYGDPDLDIHSDSVAHVEGEVVDVLESDYGYSELVVDAELAVPPLAAPALGTRLARLIGIAAGSPPADGCLLGREAGTPLKRVFLRRAARSSSVAEVMGKVLGRTPALRRRGRRMNVRERPSPSWRRSASSSPTR